MSTWYQFKANVKKQIGDVTASDDLFASACAAYCKAAISREVDHDLQMQASYRAEFRDMRKRLAGYQTSLVVGSTLDTAVRTLLPVDAEREGIQNYLTQLIKNANQEVKTFDIWLEKLMREAVIDLQSHIPCYRVGQETLYTEDDVTETSNVSRGPVPAEGQFKDAWALTNIDALTRGVANTAGDYVSNNGRTYLVLTDGTLPILENLILQSQTFDQSPWQILGASQVLTPDATTAPDGTETAYLSASPGVGTSQRIKYQQPVDLSLHEGTTSTFSYYWKAAGASTKTRLQMTDMDTAGVYADFDCSGDGTVVQVVVLSGVITDESAAIEALDDDWYRISVTATFPTSTQRSVAQYDMNSSGSISYAGSEGAHYAWGSQLTSSGAAGTYTPTTTVGIYQTEVGDPGLVTTDGSVETLEGINFAFYYGEACLRSQFVVIDWHDRYALSALRDGCSGDRDRPAMIAVDKESYSFYVWPKLDSSHDALITWTSLKFDFADGDTVPFDEAAENAVKEYVLSKYFLQLEEDRVQAASHNGAYNLLRARAAVDCKDRQSIKFFN